MYCAFAGSLTLLLLAAVNIALVIPPTQTRFPIGGIRVTCRGSKLTNSLQAWGNNNMNFGLARDEVVLLETVASLCTSRRAKDL